MVSQPDAGILTLFYGYAISRALGVGKDEAKRPCTEAMRAMLNGTLTKSAKAPRDTDLVPA